MFSNWFVSIGVVANRGKCIPSKIFEQISICIHYLHVFIITLQEIDTAAEVSLEPSPTYMLEFFRKFND